MGKVVPIAKRLKQSGESALLAASAKRAANDDDIAERIRRLEAELGSDSESDSDSDSSSSDDDDDDDANDAHSSDSSDSDSHATKKKKKKTRRKDDDSNDTPAVLSLSKYATERIDALPETLLPAARTTFPMKADKPSKKRKLSEPSTTMSAAQSSLLALVHMPKKVPFACKPCAFVGADLAAFEAHRASAAHVARLQQPPLTCQLCAKSFTGAAQLDEHRKGKWHQQRLQQKKERHVKRTCFDFARGACAFGDNCAFEHAVAAASSRAGAFGRKKQRVCQQFVSAGACKFGATCLFAHDASHAHL